MPDNKEVGILCFNSVNKEIYGIDVLKVKEVINLPNITSLPRSTKGVVGIASIRGDIIPILDLNIIFNDKKSEDSKLLIITKTNNSYHAILANSVDTIHKIDLDDKTVIQMQDRLVSILDINKIVNDLLNNT